MSTTTTQLYCTNHPQTPTLLRCNRCGRPMCLKCVERTPVGYRCRECLGLQRVGYYNATVVDYALVSGIGLVLALIGGAIMNALGGFWILAIFAGPFAGGVIAEAMRRAIQKRRGRYLSWIGSAAVVVGSFAGAGVGALIVFMANEKFFDPRALLAIPFAGLFSLFNLGFLIFVGLTVFTLFYRLRT